ncbi:uncharacterized protein LOC123427611 isoform X2 [Hordeum vulgare subsp. vulgare]|uniref:GRF-type domain-containing protein n=3 Tax=Hordeum vulgare subsp. vulgare TaxID=112509 RepID=A0A8I6XBD8_HORVV|nr:uncharacterized protein LOC123427611 isoform X2 [Hordeum vulgare subsp. vulgare]
MSMPDEFVIFPAEGKISNGPEGALVSPDCPFLVSRLPDPLNKSFEQVRRWIMQMFQLKDEMHEITLQHILYVRNNPLAPPSTVLIDIIGDDSWKAFLNVAWRHVGVFRLFVKWSAKKTASLSKAVASNATPVADEDPAVTDESDDDGSWPTCKHDKPCTIETSWDRQDPGRRFYRCPLFMDPKQDCGFTQWLDKKFPEKATEHMNYLTDKVDSLEQQVGNLKCELEELRRRHQKTSIGEAAVSHGDKCPCGKIPCGVACCNQDEKPRPSQIRRLAKAN